MVKKTTIGFSVSLDVAERAKGLFPEGRTEEVLINLLDLYEHASSSTGYSDNEQYREIVEGICISYVTSRFLVLSYSTMTAPV